MINLNIAIINRELKLHIVRPHNSTLDEEKMCMELERVLRQTYGVVNRDMDRAGSIPVDVAEVKPQQDPSWVDKDIALLLAEQTNNAIKRLGL
jgi:hypothetical protein